MSIWKRFTRLIKSLFGGAISSMEDPRLILEQNIRELNDQVPQMNENIATVKANVVLLQKENNKYVKQVENLTAKIKAAIQAEEDAVPVQRQVCNARDRTGVVGENAERVRSCIEHELGCLGRAVEIIRIRITNDGGIGAFIGVALDVKEVRHADGGAVVRVEDDVVVLRRYQPGPVDRRIEIEIAIVALLDADHVAVVNTGRNARARIDDEILIIGAVEPVKFARRGAKIDMVDARCVAADGDACRGRWVGRIEDDQARPVGVERKARERRFNRLRGARRIDGNQKAEACKNRLFHNSPHE